MPYNVEAGPAQGEHKEIDLATSASVSMKEMDEVMTSHTRRRWNN